MSGRATRVVEEADMLAMGLLACGQQNIRKLNI